MKMYSPPLDGAKKWILVQMGTAAMTSKDKHYNNAEDRYTIINLGLSFHPAPTKRIKTCAFLPPEGDEIKINVDGSVMGNPKTAGYGGIFRDRSDTVLLVIAKGIGYTDIFWVKCLAIVECVEKTIELGWLKLWI